MKFLGFNKVLCLSPHPDDVEFGMMGTILKYNDTHFDIICLSSGGDFDNTTGQNRLQEVQDAWGNQPNVTLHFTKLKLLKELSHDAWVNFIETLFTNKEEYDCLFVPTKEDSHFEHKITSNLPYVLARRTKCGIIQYKSPSTLDDWTPNFFVDLQTLVNREKEDRHS